jgi:hypothetical protein
MRLLHFIHLIDFSLNYLLNIIFIVRDCWVKYPLG